MLFPTAYLPSISWCSAFWNARQVLIDTSENYQKGSLRNRAYIAGPNGVQRLSIPLLKGKHQQLPIREVRIANHEPWQRQHWRTICTAYGNAPYFEHYAGALELFYAREYEFLYDLNEALLRFVLLEKMGWKGRLLTGGDTAADVAPLPRWLDQAGDAFDRAPQVSGSPLLPKSVGFAFYPQVFQEKHGFIPDLSILDLLFCCGKRGGEILEKGVESRRKSH